jgi:hypothetical protein
MIKMTTNNKPTHAWGIASLVLGILSLFLFLAPYIGIFLAITAVVFFGIQTKHESTGVATGGLVTGIIGIIINGIMLLFVIGALVMFGGLGLSSFDSDISTSTYSNIETKTQNSNDVISDDDSKEKINEQNNRQTKTPVVKEKFDTATMGEKNALKKAKTYLNIMAFSRDRLIEQLEFDGFTHNEAIYGVNNCGTDWNKQAALKAKTYLNTMALSRDRLIEQLKFDGFTKEQAEYGVKAVGY